MIQQTIMIAPEILTVIARIYEKGRSLRRIQDPRKSREESSSMF